MSAHFTDIELREEAMTALTAHARIPNAFEVETVFDVSTADDGSPRLTERRLTAPYTKDTDAARGEGPTRWAGRFDLANWGLISAHLGARRIGGAVLAFSTPGVHLLEGRTDLAVLWDLRIVPDHRRRGVGTTLFHAAGRWAAARGCRELKIETQNTNVPACRFYQNRGCTLRTANRDAYPHLPDEIQLLWYRPLKP